jgi:hypothetical protein
VVSIVSLLLGVHAERTAEAAGKASGGGGGGGGAPSAADIHAHLATVALTGVAGLLAGAASMACGEWCAAGAKRCVARICAARRSLK